MSSPVTVRKQQSQAATRTVVPDTARMARVRLTEMADAIVTEGASKVRTMLQVLEKEAKSAERCSTRVQAARGYLNFTLEAAKIAAELEAGVTPGSGQEGNYTNIIVMAPDGSSKPPTEADKQLLLEELTAKLAQERQNKLSST